MHNQWPSCLNASCGVSFYMGSKLHWHLERKRVYCHVKRALTSDSSAPMTHVFLYLYMEPGANTLACSAWKVHQLCCDNNMIHWTGFRTYCAEQGMGNLICSASLLWDVPFWRGGGKSVPLHCIVQTAAVSFYSSQRKLTKGRLRWGSFPRLLHARLFLVKL